MQLQGSVRQPSLLTVKEALTALFPYYRAVGVERLATALGLTKALAAFREVV